jgi:hypothetical protein
MRASFLLTSWRLGARECGNQRLALHKGLLTADDLKLTHVGGDQADDDLVALEVKDALVLKDLGMKLFPINDFEELLLEACPPLKRENECGILCYPPAISDCATRTSHNYNIM